MNLLIKHKKLTQKSLNFKIKHNKLTKEIITAFSR